MRKKRLSLLIALILGVAMLPTTGFARVDGIGGFEGYLAPSEPLEGDSSVLQDEAAMDVICSHPMSVLVSTYLQNWTYASPTQHKQHKIEFWLCLQCDYINEIESVYATASHGYSGSAGTHISGTSTHNLIYTCSSCYHSYTQIYNCGGGGTRPCNLPF